MPYISNGGTLQSERSFWRPSIIVDFFWGVVFFVKYFFATIMDPGLNKYGTSSSSGRHGGDDDAPRRRMGGFRRSNGNGVSSPPMMGGG